MVPAGFFARLASGQQIGLDLTDDQREHLAAEPAYGW
jgi:hypothetical protein